MIWNRSHPRQNQPYDPPEGLHTKNTPKPNGAYSAF